MAALSSMVSKIESSRFTWVPETKSFSAEASDFLEPEYVSRLYDDAIDMGFVMISVRTGREVAFYEKDTIVVGQGEDAEVGGWRFLPVDRELRDQGVSVVIFND